MLAFILRRILQSVVVMTVVALIAFGLFNFTGDPVTFMVGQDATQEQRAQLRADLGLDQPFYVQFARFVGACGPAANSAFRCARAGRCRRCSRSACRRRSSSRTVAALLALALGIPAGVYTALKRQSWFAQVLLAVSLIGVSLPTFLIGILLILVFAVRARLAAVVRPRRDGCARAGGRPGC